MKTIELKVSKTMDAYYPKCTIKDIAKAIIDRIGGYHISYSAGEYLKDLGLMTEKKTITKSGKHLMHQYYSSPWQLRIELIKPKETLVFEKKMRRRKS